ncbi:MAG: 50S ribosomal protein L11 [Candidatus Nealsonbacteria bacterium]|nr:50S ribosomal protein L11 [Candidatus Nealsonbacteria bacterium]
MAKKVKSIVKVQIEAGKATPAPPIGPSLAPHGINLSEFCKQFNDMTKDQMGFVIPVEITVYEDRTYVLRLKKPPVSNLIKKAIGVEKGSGEPNKKKIGTITKAQIKEIAEMKMPDLNTDNLESAMKMVEGTAKNMGVEIK